MRIPSAARRMMNLFSRHVNIDRRLPRRFGSLRLRVSPGASLIYYRGFPQQNFGDLFDFAEHYVHPGHTIWDVGSSMGVFSFSAAARAGPDGRVLSLEPDPWSASLLRRSCTYNRGRAARVDVASVAVSDRLSMEWLNVPENGRAATHLAEAGGAALEVRGPTREQHLVPTVTLEWLAEHYGAPNVLKIDVDGGELRALRGGEGLLRRCRPVILTEVYERNADAVSAFLHDLGYRLFDYTHFEAGKKLITRAEYNTLALPSP